MTTPLPSVTIVTQFLTNSDTKFDECLTSLSFVGGGGWQEHRMKERKKEGNKNKDREKGCETEPEGK